MTELLFCPACGDELDEMVATLGDDTHVWIYPPSIDHPDFIYETFGDPPPSLPAEPLLEHYKAESVRAQLPDDGSWCCDLRQHGFRFDPVHNRIVLPAERAAPQPTWTEERWAEVFQPVVKNGKQDECPTGLDFEQHVYETYGDDLAIVQQADLRTVWTVHDPDDDNQYELSNGFRIVNCWGYVLTRYPWPEYSDLVVTINASDKTPDQHKSN